MRKLALLGLIASLLTGCASGPSIKADAFGAKKRYAVISIYGDPDIGEHKADPRAQPSLFGMLRAAVSSDVNLSEPSDKMFAKTAEIVDQELSKAKSFAYVPSKALLKSAAYKGAKGNEPKAGLFTLAVAPGYKFFAEDNKQEVQRIIAENKLDGVIMLYIGYGWTSAGVNLGGLVSAGSIKGSIKTNFYAYDKDHNVVWQQQVNLNSEESVGSVGGAPNFKELYPLLEQVAHAGMQSAVSTLDTTVVAKK